MSIELEGEFEAPIVTASRTPADDGEVSLRPKTLADYTGQEKAKKNLSVYIEAARRRGEPLDHALERRPPLEVGAVVGVEVRLRDVCAGCGYVSVSYFSRLFKKETGVTPGEYRDQVLGRG